MVRGYHAIFGAYGFWLPNDPRGSWSDFVGAWELYRFGDTTKSVDRKTELSAEEKEMQRRAKLVLKRKPVQFSGEQALEVGRGFSEAVRKSGFEIWACSILPEHVHVVFARHHFPAEQVVRLIKGEATKRLKKAGLHPFSDLPNTDGSIPSPWADRKWIVYLDSEEAIENAIRYVAENPPKEGKPPQDWSFVSPDRGLDVGWVTYL
jgi:REP element-mobilizing transposase RayT